MLKRLASHTEAESARRLAERLRTLDKEESRLQQIRGYLADYTGGGTANGAARAGTMTIGRLRSNRGFLERLRHAVDEQRGTVEMHRRLVEQQTAQWRTARGRTRSLTLLGERQDEAERERQARHEQIAMDELATTRNGQAGKS